MDGGGEPHRKADKFMTKLAWETKKVKVEDLIPLDFNPRTISEEKRDKLIKSLEKLPSQYF